MLKKIKLTCNWCDDQSLYERFKRVYISKFNEDSEFEFTNSNEYDFLVIINYPSYEINFPKESTLGIILEPTWRPEFVESKCLKDLCQHILFHKLQEDSQFIQICGLLPFHLDYSEGEDLDYYINSSFSNSKNKLCSIIVSHYDENTAHSYFKQSKECLYSQRMNLVRNILQTDLDIDIYGNYWEYSSIKDPRIKGGLYNKKDGLLNYKYSIAIENCIEEGYFTEKLTDCILTDTIPIYYGCPNIEKYFSGIPVLSNLNDTDPIKKVINSNTFKPISDKKILATKYNLYSAIINYFKKI